MTLERSGLPQFSCSAPGRQCAGAVPEPGSFPAMPPVKRVLHVSAPWPQPGCHIHSARAGREKYSLHPADKTQGSSTVPAPAVSPLVPAPWPQLLSWPGTQLLLHWQGTAGVADATAGPVLPNPPVRTMCPRAGLGVWGLWTCSSPLPQPCAASELGHGEGDSHNALGGMPVVSGGVCGTLPGGWLCQGAVPWDCVGLQDYAMTQACVVGLCCGAM